MLVLDLALTGCSTAHTLNLKEKRLIYSACIWGEIDDIQTNSLVPYSDKELARMDAACSRLIEDLQK